VQRKKGDKMPEIIYEIPTGEDTFSESKPVETLTENQKINEKLDTILSILNAMQKEDSE
jgi:hypothetical protein